MPHRLPRGLCAACLLALLPFLAGSGDAVAGNLPPGGVLAFTVVRNGDDIGEHVMRFAQSPQGLDVQIRTRVVVKVAFVPVYRFEHDGRELWRDGRLEWLQSTTNDDGEHHALNVADTNGKLQVVDNGVASSAPLGIVPASLWNEAVVHANVLLNTLDGRQMTVRINDAGTEALPVGGRQVATHHYVIAGDLQREVWYDAAGTLTKVRFKAKDGSTVDYLRR